MLSIKKKSTSILNLDVMYTISRYLNSNEKKKLATCSKDLFNLLILDSLHIYAKLTLSENVHISHRINAFKQKCYLCGNKYIGRFFPVFNVYAHRGCVETHRLKSYNWCREENYPIHFIVQNNLLHVDPSVFDRITPAFWIDVHDGDFIDKFKTVKWLVENNKLVRDQLIINEQSKNLHDRSLLMKNEKRTYRFEKKWIIRMKRLEDIKIYTRQTLLFDEDKSNLFIKLLRTYFDAVPGDYFHFKLHHETTLEELIRWNQTILNSIRRNNTINLIEVAQIDTRTYHSFERVHKTEMQLFFSKIYNRS